ncbi:MAG: hypothetical protein IPN53_00015 [Comamonadaceae bacterium]|nr:hypothetical protein [Comamonadaceae bacterium]
MVLRSIAADAATQTLERWLARRAIVALPVFVAARVVENPSDWLRSRASHTAYAPWLVANIHIRRHCTTALGHHRAGPTCYGDAQTAPGLGTWTPATRSCKVPWPTVLTCYRALGDVAAASASAGLARVWRADDCCRISPGISGATLPCWPSWRSLAPGSDHQGQPSTSPVMATPWPSRRQDFWQKCPPALIE